MAYTGPYGSVAGAKALTRHIQYGTANHPAEGDLERWLAARAGQLTGWLAAAGYVTPVTLAEARAALDRFADYGAAADAEAAQRTGGYRDEDEDRREVYFAREFNRAEAWITSGALAAMGVPLTSDPDSPQRARPGAVGLLTAGRDAARGLR